MKFPNLFKDSWQHGFAPNTLRIMLIVSILLGLIVGLLGADDLSILGVIFGLSLLVFVVVEAIVNWERS